MPSIGSELEPWGNCCRLVALQDKAKQIQNVWAMRPPTHKQFLASIFNEQHLPVSRTFCASFHLPILEPFKFSTPLAPPAQSPDSQRAQDGYEWLVFFCFCASSASIFLDFALHPFHTFLSRLEIVDLSPVLQILRPLIPSQNFLNYRPCCAPQSLWSWNLNRW
jgi:hypothetical protein